MDCIFLFRLPEHVLCQMFCDWLTITDLSFLDRAFLCSSNFSRNNLLKIISESSMQSPIHSNNLLFSPCLLAWLNDRKFCVKHLEFFEREDISMLLASLRDIDLINDIKETKSEEKIAKLKFVDTISVFTQIESLKFRNCIQIYIHKANDALINLTSFSKSLTSLELEECNVYDFGHSEVLITNREHLTKLSLRKCFYLAGKFDPLLLSNIKVLDLDLNINPRTGEMWNRISYGLKSLKDLTLSATSVSSWRKSLSNLVNLEYLSVCFKMENIDEDDDFVDFFPSSLIGLDFDWHLSSLQKDKNLVSLHDLTHLRQLTIGKFNYISTRRTDDNFLPTVPPSLTAIDLSGLKYNISTTNLIQMLN
eukprot:gene16766-22943_t